ERACRVCGGATARGPAPGERGGSIRRAAGVEEQLLIAVDVAAGRRLTSPHSRPATPIELRLNLVALLALSALLAACAAPGPERPAPVAETMAAPEAPVPVPPDVVAEPEPPPVAEPFPPSVAETLQPLPPPADDIWVRIRKGFAMPDLDDPRV